MGNGSMMFGKFSGNGRSRHWKKISALAFVAGGLYLGYVLLSDKGVSYHWQWYRVWPYLFSVENGRLCSGLLIKGLAVTLKISGAGLFLALFTGVATAFARLSSYPVLRFFALSYVESIRNTPLLIQIFFMYFVIAPVMGLSAFASAVIALGLFEGAYSSEIIRSGITNVPKGQIEAAKSLGLSGKHIYIRIILPQMLPQIMPMLAGQLVSLIKDSALVSTISIYDLTMQGQQIVSRTFLTFEIWLVVALCYFFVNAGLSFLIRQLERRMQFSH